MIFNPGIVKRSKWLQALWSERITRIPTPAQSELLCVNGLSVIWRRSARRTQSLALKFDKHGQLLAMTPMTTRVSELKRFVTSREAWIRKNLARHQQLEEQKRETKGRRLWLMGEQLRVESSLGAKNRIAHEPGVLRFISRQTLDVDALDKRLTKWLRQQAESELPSCLEKLSQQTGMHGSGLQIKSYTARWGSCRHDGLIQLNWKLIKTPPEVIEYVIIHELSHLRHFNHSASFWGQVGKHCPSYNNHRKWLKDNGRLLIAS